MEAARFVKPKVISLIANAVVVAIFFALWGLPSIKRILLDHAIIEVLGKTTHVRRASGPACVFWARTKEFPLRFRAFDWTTDLPGSIWIIARTKIGNPARSTPVLV